MTEDTEVKKDLSRGVGLDSLSIDRLHENHPLMRIGMEKPKTAERKTATSGMKAGWGDNP